MQETIAAARAAEARLEYELAAFTAWQIIMHLPVNSKREGRERQKLGKFTRYKATLGLRDPGAAPMPQAGKDEQQKAAETADAAVRAAMGAPLKA